MLCYLSEFFQGSHYCNTEVSKDGKKFRASYSRDCGSSDITSSSRIVWPVGDTHESLKFSNSRIYSIVEICSPNAITKRSFMLFVLMEFQDLKEFHLVATIVDPWPN